MTTETEALEMRQSDFFLAKDAKAGDIVKHLRWLTDSYRERSDEYFAMADYLIERIPQLYASGQTLGELQAAREGGIDRLAATLREFCWCGQPAEFYGADRLALCIKHNEEYCGSPFAR